MTFYRRVNWKPGWVITELKYFLADVLSHGRLFGSDSPQIAVMSVATISGDIYKIIYIMFLYTELTSVIKSEQWHILIVVLLPPCIRKTQIKPNFFFIKN